MRRRKSKREKLMPAVPGLFTTANLFFGLLSITTSIQVAAALGAGDVSTEWVYRKFWWAGAFVVVAAFFDKLDGTIARLINSESNFGLAYDSLSDVISFGVAPGILVYVWTLMDTGKLGLMAALFYIVCAALRLARFNVQSGDVEKFTFSGLPSPMAAGVMISPVVLLSEMGRLPGDLTAWFYLFAAPFFGLLMVSNITYWKFTKFKLTSPFNALVVASIILAAVVTNPEVMLIAGVYLYCAAGLMFYLFRYFRADEDLESEETV